MKKLIITLTMSLLISPWIYSQNAIGNTPKSSMPSLSSLSTESKFNVPNPKFLSIHKEKDSPFEIYQDLQLDELVIRLKNQFDVLRFELRDETGQSVNVKGIQDKNEVHASLHNLANGKYRLIVDRNKEKLLTEINLSR